MTNINLAIFTQGWGLLLGCLRRTGLLVVPCLGASLIAAEGTGQISGTVGQASTNNYLHGAIVVIPQLARSIATDELGRFDLAGVPAGNYAIAATYAGLAEDRKTVSVLPNQTVRVSFELKSDVVQMETFQVTTERAGNAAAITRQRNAGNIINSVSTDAFGSLANQNPGEIFMRLPGVSGTVGEDNESSAVSIRGMASTLNAVTMDGAVVAPVASNATRGVRFGTNTTSQFEEFQVIKGLTPDMDASSLGGTLNMKTKSPLSMQQRSEINYRFGMRWAAPFTYHNPTRRDRPVQPDFSLSYQGVFDVLGGNRNLGLSFSASYFESVGDYMRTISDYEFTLAPRAYRYDYHTADYYFNRHLATLSARADYQVSESTRVSVRLSNNDYITTGGQIYNESRALAARTVATLDANGNPTGTGAILPNYTTTRTEVRALAANQFQLLVNNIGQIQHQKVAQLVAEHKVGSLKLNLDLNYSLGEHNGSSGQDTKDKTGGAFTTTITGVGYVLDSSRSPMFPTFTQTGGASVYDINSYRNSVLTQTGGRRSAHVYSFKGDARYDLNSNLNAWVKAGLSFRSQDSKVRTWNNTSYTYGGPDGVVGTSDDTLAPFLNTGLVRSAEFGPSLPFPHLGSLAQDVKDHPNRWVENVYSRESQKYSGSNGITEDVPAGYLMGNVKFGQLNVLGGVRYEGTSLLSEGWVLPRLRADITDPVVRARTENVRQKVTKSYSDVLPSIHFTYTFTPQLLARASYSTGLIRAPYTSLVPRETANDTARTVTINNLALKPQHGDNYDFSLEYYMKTLGLVSIGLFEKDLHDFQFTSAGAVIGTGDNNGFNGLYSGYTLTTQLNGGTARVRGIEYNYQQQLNFGYAWVRKIGVFANYTQLTSQGDYGTGTSQSVNSLAEFVPKTWNAGVRFSHRSLRANLLVNYTGEYLWTYSADPTRLLYKHAFRNTTLSLGYALKPAVEFYCDVYNLFEKPQSWYIGTREHLQEYSRKGALLNLGVRGRF